jgi:hypothetical protein
MPTVTKPSISEHGYRCESTRKTYGFLLTTKRYAFDVIGEIFFGNMFGFLRNNMDHNAYIASLDACMPVLCISAIGPTYLRPLITASSILVPAVFKAVRAIDGIRNKVVRLKKTSCSSFCTSCARKARRRTSARPKLLKLTKPRRRMLANYA